MNQRLTVKQYIKKCALNKIWYPLAVIIILCVLMVHLPIYEQLIHPRIVQDGERFIDIHEEGYSYAKDVNVANQLYYTGYDYTSKGLVKGHYYYRIDADANQIYFYILPAELGRAATSPASYKTIRGKFLESNDTVEQLSKQIATNLDWSEDLMSSICDPVLLSAVDYITIPEAIAYLFFFTALMICIIFLLRYLAYLIWPTTAPAYRRLHKYGNPEEIVADVDQQLQNECLVLTKDMALLEDYLVEFSEDLSVIVPLKDILWVYEHATLRQSQRGFKPLTYTLHIVMEDGDSFMFDKKLKEDIDTILEELSLRYPNFFYGYSDQHYMLVEHIIKDAKKKKA